MSECQADGRWSPVSLRCSFDPAAVARNMQRGYPVLWEEEDDDINLGTIITISVVSFLIIIALIIVIVVIRHKNMNAVMRARKLSRLNGVKVLPDIVTGKDPLSCMVSSQTDMWEIFRLVLQERKQDNLETRIGRAKLDHVMSKYSTQGTLYDQTSVSASL